MITHLLFQILDKFKVGSLSFRKILAVFISLMIFALIFTAVKFFKLEIPNFNRNIIMLAAIDLGGFFFLVWKKKENNETKINAESNVPQKLNEIPLQYPPKNLNTQIISKEINNEQFYNNEEYDQEYPEGEPEGELEGEPEGELEGEPEGEQEGEPENDK